jgi:hypothetical protein
MTKTISQDIKAKRTKEEKEMTDLRKREEEMMRHNKEVQEHPENKEDVSSPELQLDEYITLRVKKAQLSWTYLETKKKQEEIVDILARTQKDLEEMEAKNPEHKEHYFKKYMAARENSGLDTSEHQDNFVKFMVDDADIPEVSAEYDRLFGVAPPIPPLPSEK